MCPEYPCTGLSEGHHVMRGGFVPYSSLVKVLEIPPLSRKFLFLYLIPTTILIKEQVRTPRPRRISGYFAARAHIGIIPMASVLRIGVRAVARSMSLTRA